MLQTPTYLKGQLLLDSGQLGESYFKRSVVLICQHDADGAFGLILNRTSGNSLGETLLSDIPEVFKSEKLYIGGPVQLSALSYLVSDQFLPAGSVLPNLDLGHSIENLIEISQSFSSSRKLRMFAGYAGWSPGQLEGEMKRNAWLTHPASIDLVFDENPESLWKTILKNKGGKYRLLADMPEDLSSN
jgi:putative transcriptional regulator